MTDFFEQPKADKPIDIGIERDYSYLKEAWYINRPRQNFEKKLWRG
jgi:hypothetical protein